MTRTPGMGNKKRRPEGRPEVWGYAGMGLGQLFLNPPQYQSFHAHALVNRPFFQGGMDIGGYVTDADDFELSCFFRVDLSSPILGATHV